MPDLQQHEAMDKILKYLIDNISERPIYSYTIWNELFPDEDKEVIYHILNRIIDSYDEIVISYIQSREIRKYEVYFEANALTKSFLFNQGGYCALHEKKVKEDKEKLRLEKITNDKLLDDAKLSKLQVKAFPYIFSIGLIGGIYSIISIFFLIFGESTEKKIERILDKKMKENTEQVLIVPTIDSTLTKLKK